MYTNSCLCALLIAIALTGGTANEGASQQEPSATVTTLSACYVPATGTVYRIGAAGLPAECVDPTHVAFSWNAEGVQGQQGSAGSAGPRGEQGAPGVPGSKGEDGAEGPQGVAGIAGASGPQGTAGVAGSVGPQGVAGVAGTAGLPGAAGAAGIAGPAGVAGPVGTQGDPGAPGTVGPQGLAGAKGDTGVAGPQGDDGDAGLIGPQGPSGAKGDTGVAGPQGATGGIDGLEVVSIDYPTTFGLTNASLDCPAGKVAIAGGYELAVQHADSHGPRVVKSRRDPLNAQRWLWTIADDMGDLTHATLGVTCVTSG